MRLFWCLLSLAAIVAANPLNTKEEDPDWWKKAVFYQIYPRSFKDSDGDGIGDLNGIASKLEHLHDIGVTGLWLSPINTSPMADFGYDIADFRDIDPMFGTLKDFDALLAKAHSLGLKLILDFVPNHSSDEHEWFLKSLQRVDPYTDYYVWHDGKKDAEGNTIPPNNWLAGFGNGSAWTWREERKQFYLHQFHEKQPDLNYSSPDLVEEMKDVLRFWLDKGVDGFRVDAIPLLFEERPYENAPEGETAAKQHLPETYEMVKEWRQVLDRYTSAENGSRVMMLETYGTLEQVMNYYGNLTAPGGHFPFNFQFISDLNGNSNANDFSKVINNYLNDVAADTQLRVSNWVLGNHDNHRVSTRYGPELIDALNMLDMLLPGIGVTYNGEELGMEDTYITWDQCQDPPGLYAGPEHYLEKTRDVERTPFQWDTTTSAGFSTNATTWLPVNENYKIVNLETEKTAEKSHYHVYKSLTALRSNPTIKNGDTKLEAINDNVLVLTRTLEGEDTYILVVNLGSEFAAVDLTTKFPDLPETLTVHTSCVHCVLNADDIQSSNPHLVLPKQGIVYVVPKATS